MITPAEFPIPYPNQHPAFDLEGARSRLQIISSAMEGGCEHGLDKETVRNLLSLLFDVTEMMEPVISLLHDLNHPRVMEEYRAARCEHILKRQGAPS